MSPSSRKTKEDFFMFYDVVVNDWGETTYVPTTLGNICLVILILVLLFLAAGFIKKRSKKLSVQQLAFCAVAIALGTVLSNIKVFSFPTGGSITLLSMLVICLPGYWFGLGAGILTGVAYGVLQMLVDPYILFPAQLVVDYLLAFGALGLSGLFCKRKHGLIPGYILAVLGRYTFAVLSGWLFFGMYAWEGWNPLPYSLAYNAIYIFAEAGVTIVVLLLPPVRKALEMVKKQVV
jgi:thiamine transporter